MTLTAPQDKEQHMTPHPRSSRRIPSGGRTRRLTAGILTAALSLTSVLASATSATAAEPDWVTDPASHVNTLDGTGIGGDVVGSINNFPGATVPFGMVQFSPDTTSTYAGYQYHNDRMTGFSMNHASAGCNVFGDIPVLPATGDIGSNPKNATQRYTHDGEIGQPGYYSVRFDESNIVNELTATDRVGLARITYPSGTPAQFMIRPGGSLAGNSAADLAVIDSRTVQGSATTGNFCGKGNAYRIYFRLSFDHDFTAHGTWDDRGVTPGSDAVSSANAGAYFTFAPGTVLQAKIAVSYVSIDGAAANMAAEAPGFDFEGTRAQAHERWNDALSRVQVAGGGDQDLRGFYTALYRSLLHPNTFNDADGRYIGFDGAVHSVEDGRTQYANFSDWDTYRTLIPLQTLLFPDVASDMAQSLVVDADQSGSLPRWPVANSATGQMTGDNATALIGQIHAFGGTDFDARKALDYMVSAADTGGPGLRGYLQRPGAAVYEARHYAPQVEAFRGDHQIVGGSITLEWSIDDFTVSRLAAALGDSDIAARFQQRSNYWQNLFDPAQNAIAPRTADGSFIDVSGAGQGFGQQGFDEGNAEQYLWMVPQNITGLAHALGGREATATRLDTFTATLNSGANSPHLWAGNEPNFLVPWIYNYLGQPWKTQALVDRIRHELFSPGPDGAPGNDDLGAMSSWYVWATLGLAPATPGTSVLTLNTPTFDHVRMSLGDGKSLRIDAPGAGSGARYISGLTVDGTPLESTALPESLARDGGTVQLALSTQPDTAWATAPAAAPPAFGEGGTGFAVAPASSLVPLAPGTAGSVNLFARAFDPSITSVDVAAASSQNGVTAIASPLTPAANGSLTGALSLAVGKNVPDGFYPVTITATAGTITRTQTVIVQVAAEGGFARAANLIGTSTQDTRGGANFDNAGNSYAREELAKAGLTPGAEFAVGSLRATWPGSPAGTPDAVRPTGQTIAVPYRPTTISFVGAARDGGAQAQAKVTLDNGDTVQVPLALGDWVIPSQNGQPVFGNSIVAHQDLRHSGPTGVQGSYVYATAPYTAPSGRTIASVTLPAGGDADRLRLFAIASDGVAPQPQTTTLTAVPAKTSVTDGTPVTVTVTVSPEASGTVTVSEDVGSAARAAGTAPVAVEEGSAQIIVTPAGAGMHTYRVVFTPADPTSFTDSSTTFSITATTAPDNGGGGNTGAGNAVGGSAASPSASPAGSTATNRLGATGGDAQDVALASVAALLLISLGAGLLHRRRRTEGSARSGR